MLILTTFVLSTGLAFGIVQGTPCGTTVQVRFVNAAVPSSGDGASWATAFKTIWEATGAPVCSNGTQIWVAIGTYTPNPLLGTSGSIKLKSKLAIFGGFSGTELTLAERSKQFQQTVISGDLLGDDQPNFQLRTDNVEHVIFAQGTDTSAIIDGFRIRGGHSVGGDGGGGMFVGMAANPTVRNCVFDDNWAADKGGALFIGFGLATPSKAIVENCIFLKNKAGFAGGGVSVLPGGTGHFVNCSFLQNVANSSSAGFYSSSAAGIQFWNCSFIGNKSGYSSSGVGLSLINSGVVKMVNCLVAHNQAVLQEGGGIGVGSTVSLELANSTIVYNGSGISGGGISLLLGAQLSVSNSILWGNYSGNQSGESAQVWAPSVSQIQVNNSCVEGLSNTLGSGNISQYPGFVNLIGGDGIAGTSDDDLRLDSTSPCIDVGSVALLPTDSKDLDMDGNLVEAIPIDLDSFERVVGGSVDMGAYEVYGPTPPTGILPFGFGTPGCAGGQVLQALSSPFIGNSSFKFKCNNAPLTSLGLLMVTDAQDLIGSDSLGIGAVLHLDFLLANEVLFFDASSNIGGISITSAPIRLNAILIGMEYFAQEIWIWPSSICQIMPFGVSSSNGLKITIQM